MAGRGRTVIPSYETGFLTSAAPNAGVITQRTPGAGGRRREGRHGAPTAPGPAPGCVSAPGTGPGRSGYLAAAGTGVACGPHATSWASTSPVSR